MMDVAAMIGPRAWAIEEYAPEPLAVLAQRLGRSVDELIKLDANENPYGATARTRAHLASFDQYHRYPDPQARALRKAIGAYAGVDPASIVIGNGSDELLDLILKAFRPEPGAPSLEVINCPPTFGMYAFYATANDLPVLEVPRKPDFSLDMDWLQMACADGVPRLLFLTSPNNPDGGLLPDDQLRTLLTLPVVVILDEAYVEFAKASHVTWVSEHENLVVLRTFSKWAGLAGLRVGYGVFPPCLAQALSRLKSPYNVNIVAQEAALATLASLEEAQANIQRLLLERERLLEQLSGMPGLQVYPSQTNYVLIKIARDPSALRKTMEERGIILRYYGGAVLGQCVRISVGTPAQNEQVLDALREFTR